MTGWNLPPGCRESDIPGNRPEDRAYEAMLDETVKALERRGPAEVVEILRQADLIEQVWEAIRLPRPGECDEAYDAAVDKGENP